MNIEHMIKSKNLNPENHKILSNKDGVVVIELCHMTNSPVLKYFVNTAYRREIDCYLHLKERGIKTINVIEYWHDALLLENINNSQTFRLANKEDLFNEDVVIALAKWYKQLHDKSKEVIPNSQLKNLYSEMDLLNEEHLQLVEQKSGYTHNNFWSLMRKTIIDIMPYYHYNKTLTYNDFFYGNMVVSKNMNDAFMFDYNFLGYGLAYFDISNILSGLDEKMQNLFLTEYGNYDLTEKRICELLSPLIALIIAYKKKNFPEWAQTELIKLKSNTLYQTLLAFQLYRDQMVI